MPVKDWVVPAPELPSLERVFMLSIEQCRKIDPELKDLSDEEVFEVLRDFYGLSQLAFEKWQKERFQKSNEVIAL